MTRRAPSAGGIGTLNETSLHDALKRRYEPDPAKHEVRIYGVVADVCRDDGVIEIQTRDCYRLKSKLTKLLPHIPVTVVIPAAAAKRIWWIDPETGEASGGRLSGKHATACELWRELPSLLEFLDTPGFAVTLLLLEWDEYILRDGYGPRKARRATHVDRVLRGVRDEITIRSKEDLSRLIPEGLPETFRAADFAGRAKLTGRAAGSAVKILSDTGHLVRLSRDRQGYLYGFPETEKHS